MTFWATLQLLPKEINFVYKRKATKPFMTNREDMVFWQSKHIQIPKFREENKNIIYTENLWVNTGNNVQKMWKDKSETPRQDFLAGFSTGLK
jgi:hypothetical protein